MLFSDTPLGYNEVVAGANVDVQKWLDPWEWYRTY